MTKEMQEIALRLRPHAVCIVPEKRQEVTTEGGLDVAGQLDWAIEFTKPLLEKKIEVRLGNGLDTYSDEIDTVIISGMGGRNMIGIFKNNLDVLKKIKTVIVSPNNYQEDVKRFLVKSGFYIEEEVMVKEKKFIYQIIKLYRGKKRYTRREYFFGPIFLKKKDKLFKEYYERELKSREILMEVLPKNFRWKRFITKLEIKMIKEELK